MNENKPMYLAMKLFKEVQTEPPVPVQLPKGCKGILFVFDSEESA